MRWLRLRREALGWPKPRRPPPLHGRADGTSAVVVHRPKRFRFESSARPRLYRVSVGRKRSGSEFARGRPARNRRDPSGPAAIDSAVGPGGGEGVDASSTRSDPNAPSPNRVSRSSTSPGSASASRGGCVAPTESEWLLLTGVSARVRAIAAVAPVHCRRPRRQRRRPRLRPLARRETAPPAARPCDQPVMPTLG